MGVPLLGVSRFGFSDGEFQGYQVGFGRSVPRSENFFTNVTCLKKGPFSIGYCGLLTIFQICFGCGPLPVTVTTRIITFLIGNPYKPSFATVTGRGPHPVRFQVVTFFLGGGEFVQWIHDDWSPTSVK